MNVKQIQANLCLAGFGQLEIDGVVGPKTIEAVKACQVANKIKADGIVGPDTLAAILQPIKGNLFRRAAQLMVTFVGIREVRPNSGPDIDRFLAAVGLGSGYAWCMAVIYYCFQVASAEHKVKNPLVKTGGTIKSRNEYNGRKSLKPETGAVAILQITDLTGHAWMVISVVDGVQYTVEGNTNTNGSSNGDGQYLRSRAANRENVTYLLP